MSKALIDKVTEELTRGIASDLFEHEMTTNSKVLGRETGIEVIIGGDKAATDGKRVMLPALDKNAIVSFEAANVARGFVNHESSHVRFTNPHTVNRFKKHEKHMAFLNGMEDVRIEQRFSQMYPGSQSQFASAANATLARFFAQVDKGEIQVKEASQLVPMATAWKGRQLSGQSIDKDLMSRLETMVGADHMEVVNHLAEKATKATGTLDIARYLEKWLGKVGHETEKERDKEKEGGGMGSEGGIAFSELEADALGDGMSTSTDHYFDPSAADALQSMLPAGRASSRYISDMSKDCVWDDFDQMVKPHRSGGAMGCEAKGPATTDTTGSGFLDKQANRLPEGSELRKQGLINIKYMQDTLGVQVRAIKQALERGLIIAKQRDWTPGQTRGHLDPRRLATVATGARSFYRRRSEMDMVDTAVTLLIDMSGSMDGTKSIEAMKAAFVFAESLGKVGVPIEVLGFWSDRKRMIGKVKYSRDGIIDVPVYKSFNEPLSSSLWKIGLVATITRLSQGYNNADADSLLHAWYRLRKRQEPRKVLIVFSDGRPSTSGDGDEDSHLKRTVASLTVQGCECFGVGIMDKSVERFYPESIVINDAGELAAKAGDFLRNLLLPQQMRQRKARSQLAA